MSRNLSKLTAAEMGSLGGKKVSDERGSEYMAEIGAKGRAANLKKNPDFYKKTLSAAGVAARRKKAAEKKKQKSPVNRLAKMLIGG